MYFLTLSKTFSRLSKEEQLRNPFYRSLQLHRNLFVYISCHNAALLRPSRYTDPAESSFLQPPFTLNLVNFQVVHLVCCKSQTYLISGLWPPRWTEGSIPPGRCLSDCHGCVLSNVRLRAAPKPKTHQR